MLSRRRHQFTSDTITYSSDLTRGMPPTGNVNLALMGKERVDGARAKRVLNMVK
jgi:hypothetical protein